MANAIPRNEYPRPQLVRGEWLNLNGEWDFEIDNSRSGAERGLPAGGALNSRIIVPFCPESTLSGVGYTDFMAAVWYKREFTLPWPAASGRTILNIGACDYRTTVWVNGAEAGHHIGGYVSFSFDITAFVKKGVNTVVIRAEDDVRSGRQPRGKQSSLYHSHGCDYTRTTGIWQTVWLEHTPQAYIKEQKLTPSLASSSLYIECECAAAHGMTFRAEAKLEGRVVGIAEAKVSGKFVRMTLPLSEVKVWEPGSPVLYDLALTLGDDKVTSYFGMREVAYSNHRFYLNGKSVFQRLILDQGFYPDGIYTAPTDAELIADIRRSMDMGFNGARLHQKIFEPRFLYHCDRMGYMVWGEHGSWGLDLTAASAWEGFIPEWLETLRRDYSHPAIIGWCPLNETHRSQNEQLLQTLYDLTRAYDNTRPVIDTSGYVHVVTDIWDEHNYEQDPAQLAVNNDKYIEAHPEYAFLSEYGGIWWKPEDLENGWGYGARPQSPEEFIERYRALTTLLLRDPRLCAFCYTQLTNIEQEVNGLYTYDRKPKFDPAIIRAINTQKAAAEED